VESQLHLGIDRSLTHSSSAGRSRPTALVSIKASASKTSLISLAISNHGPDSLTSPTDQAFPSVTVDYTRPSFSGRSRNISCASDRTDRAQSKMPIPDKKRSLDAPLSADTKRQRMSAPVNAATPSSTNVFDISVFMKDEFDAFPERLRETIQEQHEALLTSLVRGYERGLLLKTKFEFTITRKVLSQPKEVFDFQVTRSKRYSDISLANQAILQEFQAKVPRRKSMITELKLEARKQPMANPALAQRHSVRSGEMSWAFDKFKCLSLYVTNETDSGLRHESIWVERVAPKTVKDPTTVKKETTTVKKAPATVKKEDAAGEAPSTVSPLTVDLSIDNPPPVNPPPVNLPPVNPTTASTSTANSTTVRVENDDDDCYIVEGPNAAEGSKLKNATAVKETTTVEKDTTADKKKVTTDKAPTTVKKEDKADQNKPTTVEKETTADKKKPMAYKAPTVTDVTDGDDDDDCVIVDGPKSSR
jgi:hypothetical protein